MPTLLTSENIEGVQLEEQAAALATPAAGFVRFYVNNTPQLAWRDDGGTIHLLVDGGAAGEIALADLASYARGSIMRGGAADWEAFVANTLGGVLIGDGNDITLDTTPTFVGLTTHSAGSVQGTGGNTATFSADGDLTFIGTSGLQFGSCYGNEIAWLQAAAVQNDWYDISDGDMNTGQLNGVTHDGNGQLTVLTAGMYMVDWAGSFEADAANVHVQITFSVNGTETDAGLNHFETFGVSRQDPCAGHAILDLAANDTINVSIRTTDAGAPDLSIDHLMLRVVQIGGT